MGRWCKAARERHTASSDGVVSLEASAPASMPVCSSRNSSAGGRAREKDSWRGDLVRTDSWQGDRAPGGASLDSLGATG